MYAIVFHCIQKLQNSKNCTMLNVLWVDCEFIIIETEPLLKNIAALYSKLNFSKMKQKSGNYKGDCLQK